MPPLFKDMSDTELRVMECLWAGSEQQGCSIREICGSLYPLGSAAQYATVQKLLDRLEAKSFVRRDRSARAHLSSPSWDEISFLELAWGNSRSGSAVGP